jgi:hypothetical protein
MGIKLKQVAAVMGAGHTPLPEGDRKRSSKKRYTVADLPFSGGSKDIHIWRKTFIPLLIAWAGTQEDPFGTNCQMEGEIMDAWKHAFPYIILDVARDYEILLNVVRQSKGFISVC